MRYMTDHGGTLITQDQSGPGTPGIWQFPHYTASATHDRATATALGIRRQRHAGSALQRHPGRHRYTLS
jgi:hypothetical protein